MYYVVWKGRKCGIFDNWIECRKHVNRFSGNQFMGFSTLDKAEDAFKGTYRTAMIKRKRAGYQSY